MKRTRFWKRFAIASVVLTLATAWVNYWVMLACFALVAISLTAYLIAQDVER